MIILCLYFRLQLNMTTHVYYADGGRDCSSDTCVAPIIVSVIIALVGVGVGIIIAAVVYIKMR